MTTYALPRSHSAHPEFSTRDALALLQAIADRGGPTPNDDAAVLAATQQLWERAADGCPEIRPAIERTLAEHPLFRDRDSIHDHCRRRPHGYAGDFELIDRIYLRRCSRGAAGARWDALTHRTAATAAVRNRKRYFQEACATAVRRRADADPARVLNVASGPGRDLAEYFAAHPDHRVQVDCVEQDANAIAYASELCRSDLHRLRFHQANAVRHPYPLAHYDLVWSAGLFDYFDDRLFVRVLTRLYRAVRPGGELVVGNFATGNPARGYMELLGDWVLHHRTPEQLRELAMRAGIPADAVAIGCEAAGVNLFLHASQPGAGR